MIKKTAGAALIDAKAEAKVTYKRLAEKAGANNYQYIQKVLNPQYNMSANTFVAVANALGYDVVMRNRVNDKEVVIIRTGGDDA